MQYVSPQNAWLPDRCQKRWDSVALGRIDKDHIKSIGKPLHAFEIQFVVLIGQIDPCSLPIRRVLSLPFNNDLQRTFM